jgi:putative pyrimidine permease RutG
VIGGLALVVFGLIAATAGRIWVGHRLDFSDPRNLLTARLRAHRRGGRSYCKIGEFALGGIGTATFGAIILYRLLRPRRRPDDMPIVVADSAIRRYSLSLSACLSG